VDGNQVNSNLKALLFWLGVVTAAVVVYQYANDVPPVLSSV
jgi:hypothetical protein